MTSKNGPTSTERLLLLYSLALLVVVVDRLTKRMSVERLVEGEPLPVFPGFDLVLALNSGAAFSFLSDAGGWQRWLLTGISLGVSIFLVAWLARLPRQQKLLGIALALILGGAIGNLIDRALSGYVIDFISVYFMPYRFATFNIADAAISVGAGLMILDILLDYRRGKTGADAP